jgi:energy-coupling factor transport system permease protein
MAFLNDITLGQYYPGRSFLHALDPRSKLLASLILMTGLLVSNQIVLVLLFVGIAGAAVLCSGMPSLLILKNLKPFVWLFLFTFGFHLLATAGESFVELPVVGISLTIEGLFNGVLYTARLVLFLVFAALLTMTTAPIELTDSLEKLLAPLKRFKFPVHDFAIMLTLSLRFLPILIREAERIKNAQLSRGATLEGNIVVKIKNISPMVLPLFISAIRRAEDLAVAMEARCYVSGGSRSSFRQMMFAGRDFAVVLIAVSSLMTVVLAKVLL